MANDMTASPWESLLTIEKAETQGLETYLAWIGWALSAAAKSLSVPFVGGIIVATGVSASNAAKPLGGKGMPSTLA